MSAMHTKAQRSAAAAAVSAVHAPEACLASQMASGCSTCWISCRKMCLWLWLASLQQLPWPLSLRQLQLWSLTQRACRSSTATQALQNVHPMTLQLAKGLQA